MVSPSAFVFRNSALRSRRGFALLITITLLAFVVILLLGLTVYTRVETAVAGNTQRQAQARENALFALNVALGQLQTHAGPDRRVTATGESFGGTNGTRHYTGVWPTDPADYPNGEPLTPLTWLVSGNEPRDAEGAPINPLAIKPGAPGNGTVQLVGAQSAGSSADYVVAPLQTIVPGIQGPSITASTAIGRYAWWIGDQGVKAPVAVADASDAVNYAPYDSADLRSRIRQQIALGAGAADANGASTFEPRDANNSPLVTGQKVTALNQVAFLRNAANGAIGLATVRRNFHTWSPNNYAVLANTKLGGLRQDLSVKPDLLGDQVQRWLDYTTYTEPFGSDTNSSGDVLAINPAYSSDPLRRRLIMRNETPKISPILSFFLLSFNVRTLPTAGGNASASPQPVQARLRGAFTLWNPYSSAMVPENLRLEISGLPETVRLDDVDNPDDSGIIPFASLFGDEGKIRFSLPWSEDSSVNAGDSRHSWLPGRTYSWTIMEDKSDNTPPTSGYPCKLNSQNIDTVSGDGVQRTIPGKIVDGSDNCHLETNVQTQIVAKLIAGRSDGDVELASFTSPSFEAFRTTTRSLGSFTYTPTFVFRLAESDNAVGAWLTTDGLDLRQSPLPPEAYVVGTTGYVNGPFPDQYETVVKISAPDRLLDRDVTSFSYNEDVPVFELPRAPLLSIGALQHLALGGQRPFAIGNSWIEASQLNGINASELFDRCFFSGLAEGITPIASNGSLLLPNPLQKVLRNSATGALATLTNLREAGEARSSKFILQGGAFNLNSTNATAWAAVLRGVRFPAQSFTYLDASTATGTAGDSATQRVQSGDAQFFRFSQSAQETYKAEAGQSGGAARTELFRQGMRTLTAAQMAQLATNIAAAIKARQAAVGPFHSLEEFLAPATEGGPSLLEQAIADAAINVDADGNPIEFSSQFLTQADIMTALAPVLFPRSDTFVIRTYGEAVNPATGATEGRAWCEAMVQRVPEYFDQSQQAETAPADLNERNARHGRRFKVVSFRWLTRSDI